MTSEGLSVFDILLKFAEFRVNATLYKTLSFVNYRAVIISIQMICCK